MDKGEKVVEKSEEIAEKVGEKILDVGEKVTEKLKDVRDAVSEKTEEMVEKAQDVLNNPEENVDAAIEKANEIADKIKDKVTTGPEDFAETTLDEKMQDTPSTLEDKDDFFDKASKFASGDYHAFDPNAQKPKLSKDPSYEAPKEQVNKPGFEDLDGDGDAVVDDAIILEEE